MKKEEKDQESNGELLIPMQAVSPLEAITKGEIDVQITTAKRYPRSIEKFYKTAVSMATGNKDIAGRCFYRLERTDKNGKKVIIEGPSIRLAEICANSWGNFKYGARIVGEDDKSVTAQGVAYDLEKNVSSSIEVSRRITTKTGVRFSDDMIQVTKNAACAIALRNAINKVIPYAYIQGIYELAKQVAVGTQKTLKTRKQELLDIFVKLGITEKQLLEKLEKPSMADIVLMDIERGLGLYTAIKDGDTTISEQFGPKSTKPDVAMPQAKKAGRPSNFASEIRPLVDKVKDSNSYENLLNQFNVGSPLDIPKEQQDNFLTQLEELASDES